MTSAVLRTSFALTASLLFLAPLLLATPTTDALAPDADALGRALAYVASTRDDPSPFRTFATTVVEGLAYAEVDPKTWPSRETNAFDLLSPYGSGDNGPYYSYLRIAYAVAISGYDPRDVNGVDYLQKVREGYVGAQFGDVRYNNDDVWAVLALSASGAPPDDPMLRQGIQNILAARAPDGGWSHTTTALAGDVDSTGMALLALAHAGTDLSKDTQARTFLSNLQDPDSGGFYQKKNVGATCQSTVWAIHGLAALGEPTPIPAVDYLHRLQNPDGGLATTLDSEGKPTASSSFCTVEALAILAGAPGPRLVRTGIHLIQPSIVRAGTPTLLGVSPAFADVLWNVSGILVTGPEAKITFATQGEYPVEIFARAENLRGRYHGTVTVVGSPPTVTVATLPTMTTRHTTVTVDARGSTDADGTVARLTVDWGDGATTSDSGLVASHAYATPGARTLVVGIVDNDGLRSETRHDLTVTNRAPTFATWPDGATIDRTQKSWALPAATDADGDPVALQWTLGNTSGTSLSLPIPDRVGAATVHVEARDPYGATAWANVTINVVNLPPRLSNLTLPIEAHEDMPVAFAVDALDPDGPQPTITWQLGTHTKTGSNGTILLQPGTWNVSVLATDSDGASTRLSRTLVVHAREFANETADKPTDPTNETPTNRPPRIENLSTSWTNETLTVTFDAYPAEARPNLRWQTDTGNGVANVTLGSWTQAFPGATWAHITVDVTWEGQHASAESPTVHAPSEAAPVSVHVTATPDPATSGAPVELLVETGTRARFVRLELGDGTTHWANESATLTHTYASPGTYVLSIFVETVDGREAQGTRTLEVQAPLRAPAPSDPPENPTIIRLESHTLKEDSGNTTEPDAQARTAVDLEPIGEEVAARRIPGLPVWLAMAWLGLVASARGRRQA